MNLELLSPAKNLDFGREAINHGADALYIGAPAFGARQAATNSIEDIEALVRYAHLYRAKVYATVNTLLFDDELEAAVGMIRRLYEAGVDALIVQDLGLLECDLPPIELHASTQCHNYDPQRIKFMEHVGFRRVILARECSLEQIRTIRQSTTVDLEAFCHGALCVSFSGQCYMSQYLNRRSGNRGQCSQPCRSRYDLLDDRGRLLLKDRHLLSLRDFAAADRLREMAEAGVMSFKIEGRLKDLAYVKNVTAYYRRCLDALQCGRTSEGESTFYFIPDVERTFNRGYTDYFLRERQPMASLATQKSLGKRVGRVSAVGRGSLAVEAREPLTAGDGLCYFDAEGRLQGFLVNEVQGRTVVPNRMPDVRVGDTLWRNHDQAFEKLLAGRSAVRKVPVDVRFFATADGFGVEMGGVEATIAAVHEAANNPARSGEQIVRQLSKLGDTPFEARTVSDETQGRFFLPASVLNQLRRDAVDRLIDHRTRLFRPRDCVRQQSDTPYYEREVGYRSNVINRQSEKFYNSHGTRVLERGLEQTADYAGRALMTTKYCLRYELGCCLRGKSRGAAQVDVGPADRLFLSNNGRRFALRFDCERCEMNVLPDEKL